ncbi:hypothetical protein [Salimicrobium humidisoli]|uniref:MarR family transcriptional regulator n=1 Tax=Salimicrobium humidisoli TaxID=2029857 RepID=A0ABX4HS42_9BACI|nr:hypothetical protein [Salimicrobium humidisoli]PBB05745.1 hypothetical protein CKW00_07020 [Salimicrobium humidisoli]
MRDYKAEEKAFRELHPETKRKAMTKNFIVEEGNVIDTDTGEVVNDQYELLPVVSGEVIERRKEGAKVKEAIHDHNEENGGFVFAYYEACKQMNERFPDLNQADLASLMFIGVHMSFGTNLIVHANGKKLDKKGLGELLGMSRNKFSQFYRKLKANGILHETDAGLMMSPEVFYRGHAKDASKSTEALQHTRMYRKTIKDLYGQFDARSMKKLGLVYSVLPYVNFRVNVVCKNPVTNNPDELNAMTIGELAEAIGYQSARKLSQSLREVKYNGQSVFKLVEDDGDARSKYIIVNPSVVYAGSGEALEGLRVLFR